MANGTVNPRSDQSIMSIDAIPGLRNELNELRSICTSSLQTTLSAFLSSYASTLHDDLASRADLDKVNAQLNNIIKVVEVWDTENEPSVLENVIKDIEELKAQLDPLLQSVSLYATEVAGYSAIASITNTNLTELKGTVEELKTAQDLLAAAVEELRLLEANLTTAQGDILNIQEIISSRSAENEFFKQTLAGYITVDEDNKITAAEPIAEDINGIKETLTVAEENLPLSLTISKTAQEEVEEPEELPEGEQQNELETFNPQGYLDYQLTFKAKENTELTALSQPLALTEDINNYLKYSFYRFRRDYLDTTLALSDSRLSEIASCLANLTQFVSCLASHHNFVIKDIYLYFADGANGIGLLPSAEKDLVLINTNFPDYARIDNKTLTPVEVSGRTFYVIFKTSYPIDLGDNKVSLTFPDLIESDKTKYAPAEFRCTRIGIPDITNAFYVLHNTAGDNNPNLIPFTFGGIVPSVFGNLFTQRGTYNFMLNVTDPYNYNVTATKSKQVTIGYPIYYGVYETTELAAESVKSDFTLLHTELNSPATTLDWAIQNKDRTQAVYYYYVVPKALLEDKILNFNTGYGPGGWEVQNTSIVIDGLEYLVFHTAHALTYCPTTMVTVSNIQTIN